MKKFILFFSLGLLFSCETTLVETSAGYHMDGSSYILGSDEDNQIAMDLVLAYADSIKRTIWNSVPLIRKGTDYTRVTVAFSENRFLKDGTQENLRIVDRIFIRDGKIFRVNQWDAEME